MDARTRSRCWRPTPSPLMPGRSHSLPLGVTARSRWRPVWEGEGGSVSRVRIRQVCAGPKISKSGSESRRRLGARLDAGPLLIEQANRVIPAVVRHSLITQGQLLAQADAGVEQVDRGRLLARVELVG